MGSNGASAPDHIRPRSASESGYLPTLDGWRAVAILLVIGAHSVSIIEASNLPARRTIISLLNHAGYGVDVFFALSGFLITTLLLMEKERSGKIDLSSFYIRRFFRIFPPMAVYLAAIWVFIPMVAWTEILASALFYRNYSPGSWYSGHFWSLSIEEHFYAIVPLMVLMLRRNVLLAASILLIVACIAVRWYEFTYLASSFSLPQFRTENRIDALMWGSVVAQLLQRLGWRDRLMIVTHPAMIAAIGVVAMAALVSFEGAPVRRTITAFVLALMILSTTIRPHSWVGQALEWRPVRYKGRLSYSLYIWQMVFLVSGQKPLGELQSAPWAFLFVGLCAWGSYNFVEKPCIRAGHAYARRLSSNDVSQARPHFAA